MLFEATDVAEDRRIGIERQANFSLERLLGGSLTFDDGGLVVRDVDELVARRVPLGRVHAVDDAFHTEFTDDVIELNALSLAGCDLLGVVFGHGQVLVGVHEARLEPVGLAVNLAVEFLLAVFLGRVGFVVHFGVTVFEEEVVSRRVRQAVGGHRLREEATLERDVVNRHRALGLGELTRRLHHLVQDDRDERGVPVVCDEDDVFAETEFGERRRRLDGGVAEHREAILVVREVVPRLFAVKLGAGFTPNLGQEVGVIDEHAIDALLLLVEEANRLTERFDVHGGVPRALVLIVTRRDRHHLVPALGELHRQRSHDVTEATGLRPRRAFRGHENNFHRSFALRDLRHGHRGFRRRANRGRALGRRRRARLGRERRSNRPTPSIKPHESPSVSSPRASPRRRRRPRSFARRPRARVPIASSRRHARVRD